MKSFLSKFFFNLKGDNYAKKSFTYGSFCFKHLVREKNKTSKTKYSLFHDNIDMIK